MIQYFHLKYTEVETIMATNNLGIEVIAAFKAIKYLVAECKCKGPEEKLQQIDVVTFHRYLHKSYSDIIGTFTKNN